MRMNEYISSILDTPIHRTYEECWGIQGGHKYSLQQGAPSTSTNLPRVPRGMPSHRASLTQRWLQEQHELNNHASNQHQQRGHTYSLTRNDSGPLAVHMGGHKDSLEQGAPNNDPASLAVQMGGHKNSLEQGAPINGPNSRAPNQRQQRGHTFSLTKNDSTTLKQVQTGGHKHSLKQGAPNLVPNQHGTHTYSPMKSDQDCTCKTPTKNNTHGHNQVTPTKRNENQENWHPLGTHKAPQNGLSIKDIDVWAGRMVNKYIGQCKPKDFWFRVFQRELKEAGGTEAGVPLHYVSYIIENQILPWLLIGEAWPRPTQEEQGTTELPPQHSPDPEVSQLSSIEVVWSESQQSSSHRNEVTIGKGGRSFHPHPIQPSQTAPLTPQRHFNPSQDGQRVDIPDSYNGPPLGWPDEDATTVGKGGRSYYPHLIQPKWIPRRTTPPPPQQYFNPSQDGQRMDSPSSHSGPPVGWPDSTSISTYDASADLFPDYDKAVGEASQGEGEQGREPYDPEPTPYPRQPSSKRRKTVSFAEPTPPFIQNMQVQRDPPPRKSDVPSLLTIQTEQPTHSLKLRYDQESYDKGIPTPRARAPMEAIYIKGPKSEMSNMYPAALLWKGNDFSSGEQMYQWFKHIVIGDKATAEHILRNCSDPFEAKRVGKWRDDKTWSGKTVGKEERDKWARQKIRKQIIIWQCRFCQDLDFKVALRESVGRPLIHPVCDAYWGTYRYGKEKVGDRLVSKKIYDGQQMYTKLLMAFRDEVVAESRSLVRAMATTEANQHRSLCNMVREFMLPKEAIPKHKEETAPRGPPPSNPEWYKIIYGDSLVNDKSERSRRSRDLQRECRKACSDQNLYVSSFPGKKLEEMKNMVGDILQPLGHIKPEQVSDIVIAGGINDVLAQLTEIAETEGRKSKENKRDYAVPRDERTERAQKIVQHYKETVAAVRSYFPTTTVHVTEIIDHPILKTKRYGFHLRDHINKELNSIFQGKVPIVSHHFRAAVWDTSKDGLHLTLPAKEEYGLNLASHFEACRTFRK